MKQINELKVIVAKNKNQFIVFVVFLLGIGYLAYNLSIKNLGFYWDDWEAILLNQLTISQKHINFYISDRPTWAWMFSILLPFLKVNPIRWHLFVWIIRFGGIMFFYWALVGIWPKHKWQIFWICLLFMVFPGFSQTPVAATYSKHFLIFAFYSLSLWFMVWSIKKPKYYIIFTFFGVLTSLIQIFTLEYFVGLELLRPIILLFLIDKDNLNKTKKLSLIIKKWSPYLLSLILFMIYRFGYFSNISDENVPYLLENLFSNPIQTIRQLVQLSIQDFVHSLFIIFANAMDVKSIEFKTLGSYLISFIVVGIITIWFNLIEEKAGNSKKVVVQGITLGLFAFFLGGLPIWTTNRQVVVGLWSDRFILAPMVGASIIIVFLVEWLLESKHKKSVVMGFLLFVSLAYQIRNTDTYKENWQIQKDYYWELYWRAPALQENTAILGPKMPFSLIGDYSVGIALNSIYANELKSVDVPYWFINTSHFLGWDIFPDYEKDLPIEYDYRNIKFRSNTSNGLGVTNDSGKGCVLVLDDIYKNVHGFTEYEYELFKVSNLDQIVYDDQDQYQTPPPKEIFGEGNENAWCYYFEKADLARQMGDWEEVARLGDEAESNGYRTKISYEMIPFIEGYAHMEEWDKAIRYTDTANRLVALMQPVLCDTWERIDRDMSQSAQVDQYVSEAYDLLACSSIH